MNRRSLTLGLLFECILYVVVARTEVCIRFRSSLVREPFRVAAETEVNSVCFSLSLPLCFEVCEERVSEAGLHLLPDHFSDGVCLRVVLNHGLLGNVPWLIVRLSAHLRNEHR